MDAEELRQLNPPKVLRRRFELELALESNHSLLGHQLESARTGIQGAGHNGAGSGRWEEIRLEYAEYAQLTRDLNHDEIDLCRLRYLTLAEAVPYEQNKRLEEACKEGSGEEIVSPRVLDDKGEPVDGWVRVRSMRSRPASYERAAEHLRGQGQLDADGNPIGKGAVKRRAEEAHAKVRDAIRWRLMLAIQEEAAA